MTLIKVISGGQTGADQAGIIEARKLGLETGGWAPRGWRTEAGAAPWLAEYGLKEHPSPNYQPRTYANVRDSEATLWFVNIGSPGYTCTYKAMIQLRRLWYANPDADRIRHMVTAHHIINIAGNRLSTNPAVYQVVVNAFRVIASVMAGEKATS